MTDRDPQPATEQLVFLLADLRGYSDGYALRPLDRDGQNRREEHSPEKSCGRLNNAYLAANQFFRAALDAQPR